MTDIQVVHNRDAQRFETNVDGHVAVLLYRVEDGRMVFTSTQVPRAIEGRGIGSALTRAGLAYAREQSLTVVPVCSFVRAYIERHPEYESLVE
jgi:uncharacterized protein